MNNVPLAWKIATVRGEMLELDLAVRQLHRSALDSAGSQLPLTQTRRTGGSDEPSQAWQARQEDYVSEGGLVRSGS